MRDMLDMWMLVRRGEHGTRAASRSGTVNAEAQTLDHMSGYQQGE